MISEILFITNDIARIIHTLDSNKAHGHAMISICMLKICDESKTLEIIFKCCIEICQSPNEWKKSNVVPAQKKIDR